MLQTSTLTLYQRAAGRGLRCTAGLLVASALLAACDGTSRGGSIEKAELRLQRGELAGAVIEAKNALQRDPQSARARFVLGRALFEQGELALAETELQRAVELGHPEEQSLPALASLMLAQGKAPQVVAMFGSTKLSDPPGMADLLLVIAQAHLALGDRASAASAVADALKAVPGHVEGSVLKVRLDGAGGQQPEASRAAADLLGKHPDHPAVLLLNADLAAQAEGRRPEAVALYRKALEKNPRLVEAHGHLISLLATMGDLSAAAAQAEAMARALPGRALPAFYRALVAYLAGDYRKVREYSQPLLKGAVQSPQLLYIAGMAEARLGALGQAESLLGRAVALAPDGVESRRELAALYLRQAKPAAALEMLKPMIRDDAPGDAASWRVAGQAHAQAGDFRSADRAFARALKLQPEDPRAQTEQGKSLVARGDFPAGIRELQAAAERSDEVDADLALVAAHMRKGDTQAALKAADSLAKKRPSDPNALLVRAQILKASKDLAGARKALESALVLNGSFGPALVGLAELDLAAGDVTSARDRYMRVLKRDPNSLQAMLALAEMARNETGSLESAKVWLDKALEANPSDPRAWQSVIMFHRTSSDLPGALARANAAVSALPDDPVLLALTAEVQLANRSTQQAIASLNRATTLLPRSADLRNRLARVHLAAGNPEAAKQSAAAALELSPAWPEALRTQIAAFLMAKDSAGALAVARSLQKQRPDSALGWQLEGETFAALGNATSASEAFKKAMAKGESSELVTQLHASLSAEGKSAEADALVRGRLKKQPDDALLITYLGQAHMGKEQWAESERYFREALRLMPAAPAVMNNLAFVLLRQENLAGLKIAQDAFRAAPFSPEIADTLALGHFVNKDPKRAVIAQTRALELAPDNNRMRLELARYLLAAGEKGKALDALNLVKDRRAGSDVTDQEIDHLMARIRG